MPVQSPVEPKARFKEPAVTAGSTKPSLIDVIPIRLVLFLASPYLAGRTAEDAVNRAHTIYRQSRFTSTIDILGEDATRSEDCDDFTRQYRHVIDLVTSTPLPVSRAAEQMTISLKPSMFSTVNPSSSALHRQAELDRAYERIRSITEYARKRSIGVTLEAEDRTWTDFHLDTYFSLIDEGYTNLGTVLQTRLFRTKQDITRFDQRMRVRLVIGIYNEPSDIALTDKAAMKDLLVAQAEELLDRGVYVELATHDSDCLEKFFREVAVPRRIATSRFETQFLLGVPRRQLQESLASGRYFKEMAGSATARDLDHLSELASTGVLVRMYLPYGKDAVAGPYCKRRLKANPNMISYGIKNLLGIQ